MSKIDRRSFIKSSLTAATAATAGAALLGCESVKKAPAPVAQSAPMPDAAKSGPTAVSTAWQPKAVSAQLKPRGANDDIRLAIIGFNRRGSDHIKSYLKIKGVRIVALCDADSAVLAREKNKLKDSSNVQGYQDLRKLLDNPDIDAISTATPNFWHSLLTVWACQAGKDVYVEKPVSHEPWEGRKAFEASRKYNRIVQAGTQWRSDVGMAEAFKALQGGELGKILLCRGLCYKLRESIGKVPGAQVPPKSVDYDLWVGPSKMEPLMREHLHYDWHWLWETGNGDIGNQGIHEMDKARWACGAPTVSSRVIGFGGRFACDDDANTPNTQVVYHDFGPSYPPIIFEVRGLPRSPETPKESPFFSKGMPVPIGDIIHCEGGCYASGNSGGGFFYDKAGKKMRQVKAEGGENHMQNFIDCVRSRKREDQKADILGGHISSALCHTGNISYRLGQKMSPEEAKSRFSAKADLDEAFERMREHLAINKVDITKDLVTVGPWLEMDPKTETFTGPDDWTLVANSMLRRNYRRGFEVPENV